MYGYKKDDKIPGVFFPKKSISRVKLEWTDEEIKFCSEHSDSPSFIENLKRYNGLHNP